MSIDHTPPARSSGYVSKSMIDKLIKGGKKGEKIHKKREEDHKNKELPQAEEDFLKDLQALKKEEVAEENKSEIVEDRGFWAKIRDFFKKEF